MLRLLQQVIHQAPRLSFFLLILLLLRLDDKHILDSANGFILLPKEHKPKPFTTTSFRKKYPQQHPTKVKVFNNYDSIFPLLSSWSKFCSTTRLYKRSTEQFLEHSGWLLNTIPHDDPTHTNNKVSDIAIINTSNDDEEQGNSSVHELESLCIQYLADLIRAKLNHKMSENNLHATDTINTTTYKDNTTCNTNNNISSPHENSTQSNNDYHALYQGRFRDLTCTIDGELTLEQLFNTSQYTNFTSSVLDQHRYDLSIITQGSVIALQSLLIFGSQVGVKGSPEQQQQRISYLQQEPAAFESHQDHANAPNNNNDDSSSSSSSSSNWDHSSIRRLKHKVDITAAIQLLAELKRKRTSQGAFDLLVQLGAWTYHEDIALLRSGFPIRFTNSELKAAQSAEFNTHDPDTILGIRQDLRYMKVYTIDSELTQDIDDGLSIETYTSAHNQSGKEGKRIWIHIADADRWAPRDSPIFQSAQRRISSLYFPTGSVPMFPEYLSYQLMSLRADRDSSYALSLGVELKEDGSIDIETLVIMPSLIKVDYRLTYEEVDEMLEFGVGYFEEWELGALLECAKLRRKFRIENGSTEGFVPCPIPQAELTVLPNREKSIDGDSKSTSTSSNDDDVTISMKIEVTHNAGTNHSSVSLDDTENKNNLKAYVSPVSSAYLLVTEMMILAGEAMGKLREKILSEDATVNPASSPKLLPNTLDLPYRSQSQADLSQRYQEVNTLESLRYKGGGYCHAWYARRFFEPIQMTLQPQRHTGLGLDCYVQWSSPIRRFSDLQVHTAVKRYLRKKQVNEWMMAGRAIPSELRPSDLGCDVPMAVESSLKEDGKYTEYTLPSSSLESTAKFQIDYKKGLGLLKAARFVQKQSKEYWHFEYLRRLQQRSSSEEVAFETVVLACVDPKRYLYAIYVHELGMEHKYLSEKGALKTGETIWLKVSSISPRQGLLTFTLASKSSGNSPKSSPAA